MSRSLPITNLRWAETHVVVKATLPNGTILRLGTATLSNVPEPDGNSYSYVAKIIKDSSVKLSTTRVADQMVFNAENVDKALGLTLNNVSTTLVGAKVTCSKVFTDAQNTIDVNSLSPAFWFNANDLSEDPNDDIIVWPDKSANNRDAKGTATMMFNQINGQKAVSFNPLKSMSIAAGGSFVVAQVFAVFVSPNAVFSTGSIIGSNASGNRLFEFVNLDTKLQNFRTLRHNGLALSAPYSLNNIQVPTMVNVKVNNHLASRPYSINNMDGKKSSFVLSELIGFTTDLSVPNEQRVEHYLADEYGVYLPYTPTKTWDSKVLLTGEIAHVDSGQEETTIKIISDLAPSLVYISSRPVQSHCPLIFKGTQCGYTGPLTTCNYLYQSDDGCSGRNNQHRFGGVVIRGELPSVISGGVDTDIADGYRYGSFGHGYYPDPRDGRIIVPDSY